MENFIVLCIFYCNLQMNILIQIVNLMFVIVRCVMKFEVKNVMLLVVIYFVGMCYFWDGVSLC